jgi:hypothetical protein
MKIMVFFIEKKIPIQQLHLGVLIGNRQASACERLLYAGIHFYANISFTATSYHISMMTT